MPSLHKDPVGKPFDTVLIYNTALRSLALPVIRLCCPSWTDFFRGHPTGGGVCS